MQFPKIFSSNRIECFSKLFIRIKFTPIHKLKILMEKLEAMLNNRKDTKKKVREYIPLLNNMNEDEN